MSSTGSATTQMLKNMMGSFLYYIKCYRRNTAVFEF